MTRKFDIHLSRKQVKGLQRKDLEDKFMEVQKEITKKDQEITRQAKEITKKDQEINRQAKEITKKDQKITRQDQSGIPREK